MSEKDEQLTPESQAEVPEPSAADEHENGEMEAADAGEATAESETAEPTPEAQVADLKDKLLRAMAETENVRRRSQRELADARKYAAVEFARDVLTVSDNLKRALESVGDVAEGADPALKQLLDGVALTERELAHMLEKHGVRQIEPMGEKLDPNLHQAMMQIEDGSAEAGTVLQVMQVGYTIHDRLLRAAMVGVAKAPDVSKAGNADTPDADEDAGPGRHVDTEA